MDLVTPSIGLIFWQIILFILLFFLLTKFAWKPTLAIIEKRQEYLRSSLRTAQKAQERMISFEKEKENWIKQSRVERDLLLKQAKILSNQIMQKARENAKVECREQFLEAKRMIENQKKAARNDIKNELADLSIRIVEKLLKKELKRDKEQEKLVLDLVVGLNISSEKCNQLK